MTKELQKILNHAVDLLELAENHGVQLTTTKYYIRASRVTVGRNRVDNYYIRDLVTKVVDEFKVEREILNSSFNY